MANRHELSSIQWQVIHQILQTLPQVRVGNEARCLAFLNAVVWILRSGTQWRLLPQHLPVGKTAARRLFDREFPDLFSWLERKKSAVRNPLALTAVPS
jgi:transposase